MTLLRFALLTVLSLLADPGHAKPPAVTGEDWTWVMGRAALPASDLLADKKFVKLLQDHGPRLKVDLGFNKAKKKNAVMADSVREALSGVTDTIQIPTPETIVITGCRESNCQEKGFIWMDLSERKMVFALVHFLFEGVRSTEPQIMYSAKALACKKIPTAAVEAIKNWVRSIQITPIEFRCADR